MGTLTGNGLRLLSANYEVLSVLLTSKLLQFLSYTSETNYNCTFSLNFIKLTKKRNNIMKLFLKKI